LLYDLIVIGAGSGGVRTARMAAQAGKKVAIVEHQALGGTCVNVGCVPKKLLVYASHYSELLADARGFGWTISQADFSWQQLVENKNQEILRLNNIYENLLLNAGVTVVKGRARFIDKNTLDVAGQNLSATAIVIATGSRPFIPDIPGKEYFSTSNEMFFLEKLPEKLLIVGGGFIALEFAGIMKGLGVETHIVCRGEQILRGFDHDVRYFLAEEMRKKGIHIHLNTHIQSLQKHGTQVKVSFEEANNGAEIPNLFDCVLCATGRIPNTEALNLDALKLGTQGIILGQAGAIVVDEQFRTSIANIYALGDVINRIQLTPVAIAEAMILVRILCGDNSVKMDYQNIPHAVFSQPSVACVGLSEEQARESGKEIEIYETDFNPMKYALSDSDEATYMKLVVEKTSNKVIGAHMVGADAAEIIQGIAIAIKAGASKKDFDNTVGIHPSAAEEFVTMRSARK
jgi:glutathione reductase (NADPH)